MKAVKVIFYTMLMGLLLAGCDSKPKVTPTLTALSESMITSEFNSVNYPDIKDVGIYKKPGEFTIVLIVGAATAEEKAKDLLDSLVRQTIVHSDDEGSPGKEIGKTSYDYNVAAYTIDEKMVVSAAKVSRAKSLYW